MSAEKRGLDQIALDTNILNWLAYQGLGEEVQKRPENRLDYEAIVELFALQDKGCIILAGPNQVWREVENTMDESKRLKLSEAWGRCKQKYCLTRYPINLKDGAYWMTRAAEDKFQQYLNFARTEKERRDLEVLASVAIAGFTFFVTVDYGLLANQRIRSFVMEEDNIGIYRPVEIVKRLGRWFQINGTLFCLGRHRGSI